MSFGWWVGASRKEGQITITPSALWDVLIKWTGVWKVIVLQGRIWEAVAPVVSVTIFNSLVLGFAYLLVSFFLYKMFFPQSLGHSLVKGWDSVRNWQSCVTKNCQRACSSRTAWTCQCKRKPGKTSIFISPFCLNSWAGLNLTGWILTRIPHTILKELSKASPAIFLVYRENMKTEQLNPYL